jgi:hypothetical protein
MAVEIRIIVSDAPPLITLAAGGGYRVRSGTRRC